LTRIEILIIPQNNKRGRGESKSYWVIIPPSFKKTTPQLSGKGDKGSSKLKTVQGIKDFKFCHSALDAESSFFSGFPFSRE
jgi:hypothetical protein